MADPEVVKPFTLDAGTLFSLALAFSLMPAAQLLARLYLPAKVSTKLKVLFLWHAYDFLTHFILEGAFLYHCFFSYTAIPPTTSDYPHPASLAPHGVYFLGYTERRYGSLYSTAPMARLWQEYAKADRRWGGADLTVISLELLTVGLGGPLAMYICYLISQVSSAPGGPRKARLQARMWMLMIMLATGELYGGFMTFAPEWLSGNSQLATHDPVYLWLYLFFFNVLWVFIPLWVLWQAWAEVKGAFQGVGQRAGGKKSE